VLRAGFDYGAWPELLAAFPFPHQLVVEAAVAGARMAVATTLRASGSRPVPVAFGWHPYLRLPGPPRSAWRLLLPEREHLELDDRGLPTGIAGHEPAEAEALGERTFDDLYALGPERTLGLEGGGRRLLVDYGDGYRYAQVFAPPDGEFVCLEPMTASTNALGAGTCAVVEPGGAFTARFALRVEEA
jgi:aldose 1-epimerase